MGIPVKTTSKMLRAAFLVALVSVSSAIPSEKAGGKAFSLFNVVTFKNDDCISTSNSPNAGALRGRCYTSTECEERGGTAAGGCASGFGTCCVFTQSECGGEVNENGTYIRNADFPQALSGEDIDDCNFEINRCDDEVCTIRLDFHSFDILAGTGFDLANALVDSTSRCQDTFAVDQNANGFTTPVICGLNTDQHMYIEIGEDDSATIAFTFAEVDATRTFEIKVTQFHCDSEMRPPEGCLQYHTGIDGSIQTFNYDNDDVHLENQQYSICIRKEMGFCCIEYTVCDAEAGQGLPYSLGLTGTMLPVLGGTGGVGGFGCINDFITIEGGSEVCGAPTFFSKFCGDALSTYIAGAPPVDNAPICDCTPPFIVGISTDAADVDNDGDGVAEEDEDAGVAQSRGVCLNYLQKPC